MAALIAHISANIHQHIYPLKQLSHNFSFFRLERAGNHGFMASKRKTPRCHSVGSTLIEEIPAIAGIAQQQENVQALYARVFLSCVLAFLFFCNAMPPKAS